jgi:hypothetical protein
MSLPADTLNTIHEEWAHAQQAPALFFDTWKQAVQIAGPHLFGGGTATAVAAANSKWDLRPDVPLIITAIGVMSSGERVFLAALVSFYNAHDGGNLLKRAGVEGLADLGSLDLKRRRLIAALILSYDGW